jgi:hypothetical protein
MNENDGIIPVGPPLRLTPWAELIEELCGRRDIPSFMLYQTECADGDEDSGETNFLSRHSFADKEELARMLQMVADSLEGIEREITIAPFA